MLTAKQLLFSMRRAVLALQSHYVNLLIRTGDDHDEIF